MTTRKLFFPSNEKIRLKFSIKRGQFSEQDRYQGHDKFLRQNKHKIGVFADIGCCFAFGAPTTLDARKALGNNAEIYGTDIANLPNKKMWKKYVERGINPLKHNIAKSPLPFRCDAIRFANVSQHMSQSDRRRAIFNIWKSLKIGGFLLGATDYMRVEHEFILRKTASGFEEIEF